MGLFSPPMRNAKKVYSAFAIYCIASVYLKNAVATIYSSSASKMDFTMGST